jgi:acyl-CoA thioesterase-1
MQCKYFIPLLLAAVLLPAKTVAGTILVIGDSLSAAYGLEIQAGWVVLLQQRLKAEGYSHQVVNASISGDTTASGLARLPQALNKHRPEIVIIELGGNDGLRGLPLAQMKHNIAAMITKARAQGAKVLLVGVLLPPNYGRAYVEKFRAVFRELAERYDVPLAPFILEGVATRTDLMQSDGIHPTARAQPIMLDNVWPYLAPLISGSQAIERPKPRIAGNLISSGRAALSSEQ